MVHFPLAFFSPPGCNTHVGGCGGSTKLMPQIKINLIISNFTPTRAFSSYNTKRAAHGRIHYTFTHSVMENTVNVTKYNMKSNGNQSPVSWIKRLDIVHLAFSVAFKKRRADQRNTKIMELEGFGSRKRTIYFAKRTWASTVCLVECLLGTFCCGRLKVFLVYRGPTGSVSWTAVGLVFSGAFEVSSNGEIPV